VSVPATTCDLEPATVVSRLVALAQDTRLAVFRPLVQRSRGGETAGELARQQLDVSPKKLSFHLKEMAETLQ
jgi:DNA-binding transcriptional ArsR family regulator